MSEQTRIITLDISLVATGYAVLDLGEVPERLVEFGCVTTKPDRQERLKGADDIRRVSDMALRLSQLTEDHRPALIIGELPYGSRSAASAKAQGICLGVFGSLRIYHAVPCHWVTPQSTKKALTGRMDASKEQVFAAVAAIWPEITEAKKGEQEHIADALAAAVASRQCDLYRMVASRKAA